MFSSAPDGEIREGHFDDAGCRRAVLGEDLDSYVGLSLFGCENQERAAFKLRLNGNPEVVLNDYAGVARLRLYVNEKGEPKILLSDDDGDNLVKIAVNEEGQCIIELRDFLKNPRVLLHVASRDDGGFIAALDERGYVDDSLPKKADLFSILGNVGDVVRIIRGFSS